MDPEIQATAKGWPQPLAGIESLKDQFSVCPGSALHISPTLVELHEVRLGIWIYPNQ